MKNLLISLIITLCSAVLIYFIGNFFLKSALEAKLQSVPQNLESYGIKSTPPSIEGISVNSSKSLTIKEIRAGFSLLNKKYHTINENFLIRIPKLSIISKDYDFTEVDVIAENLSITGIQNQKDSDSYERITIKKIETTVSHEDKYEVVNNLINEISNIFSKRQTNLELNLDGKVNFVTGEFANLIYQNGHFAIDNLEILKNYKFNDVELKFYKNLPLRIATIQNLKNQSLLFQNNYASAKNKEAVFNIHFLTSLIKKFGNQSKELIEVFLKNNNSEHLTLARQYLRENQDLIKLIEEQGDKFPIQRRASFKVNK